MEVIVLRGALVAAVVVAGCGGSSSSERTGAHADGRAGEPNGALTENDAHVGQNAKSDGSVVDIGHDDATTTHVFVIAMENQSASGIFGSPKAPYINQVLLPHYASASNFVDELPTLQSEAHYVWMEAGTNVFADHTFQTDDPPSATNSTATPDHLATQIQTAGGELDWMAYVESTDLTTQPCPIAGSGTYVPRHDPFLYFRDISGAPPSKTNVFCAAHHRPLSALASDLTAGTVAAYVFIAPDLCHDMHGSSACSNGDKVQAGDSWLSGFLPGIITYVNATGGVVFIVWDEAATAPFLLPFVAVGPGVKPGYSSAVPFNHGSLLKSVEEMLRLPILPTVQNVSDFADLFVGNAMP